MNAVPPPPPGWYPDPSGRAPFRYWEGSRWTEHTDQGTAAAPSTSPHMLAAHAAPPAVYAATPVGQYASLPLGTEPQSAAPTWTAATFLADLKRLDGVALVVVGAVLFIVCSFLPWTSVEVSGFDFNGSPFRESIRANGWEGQGVWMIRGWEVTDSNVRDSANGIAPSSGSDMVVLLPIALVAAGIAATSRLGKRISHAREIVLGVSGVLALLMIAEAMHVSGAIGDVTAILSANNLPSSGGISFGMYLCIMATLLMAGGATKAFLEARNSSG